MMSPLTASLSYILMNELAGRRITDVKKTVNMEDFKQRMFFFTIGKLGFTLIGFLLVLFGFKDPIVSHNRNGPPKRVLIQVKNILSDPTYLLFVLPLISAGLIEASNNHIYSILSSFSINYVPQPQANPKDRKPDHKNPFTRFLSRRRLCLYLSFPAQKTPTVLPNLLQLPHVPPKLTQDGLLRALCCRVCRRLHCHHVYCHFIRLVLLHPGGSAFRAAAEVHQPHTQRVHPGRHQLPVNVPPAVPCTGRCGDSRFDTQNGEAEKDG